ncbi:DNA primase [Candidatus Gracilibacteria bacterium]|nr:DNA primase [Candidatus Gracilibacteria bacterium]
MSFVDELEQSIDIIELVGRYTKLKKAGVNYKSLCPFPGHNESTPSFVVSPAKQIGYCFGCHKAGGPLKFLMDIENCEFREAVEILANITGKEVEGFKTKSKEEIQVQKNMYSLYRDAAKYYKKALAQSPEILKYLSDRGITHDDQAKFHFGYADSGVGLYTFLKELGYSDELIRSSQIFVDIGRRKDKFIGRVIFPLQNNRGDFVAFAGRIIGTGEPKYLNSPASDIYDKSSLLYGLYEAKNTITKNDRIIICEGYMDVIALHRAGYFETVAVSGTALTEKHITLIKRLTRKIYLCFDSDKAGVAATKSSLEILKNKELEIRIIQIPSGKDPDEYITSGKDFGILLENALSPIAFAQKHQNYNLSSLDDTKKFLTEMLEYIASFSSTLERDFYLKELAKLTETKLEVIYEMMKTHARKGKSNDDKNDKNIQKRELQRKPLDCLIVLHAEGFIHSQDIRKKLLFPEALTQKEQQLLFGEISFSTLSLDEKEYYRGLALELSLSEKNEGETEIYIQKLIFSLNKEHFKSLEALYKHKLIEGESGSLELYSELLQKAKQAGVK